MLTNKHNKLLINSIISCLNIGEIKMSHVINETLATEIKGKCEVLVAGGGIAGIAAALAAARTGADVLLLEREYILGGLGTAGIVTITCRFARNG